MLGLIGGFDAEPMVRQKVDPPRWTSEPFGSVAEWLTGWNSPQNRKSLGRCVARTANFGVWLYVAAMPSSFPHAKSTKPRVSKEPSCGRSWLIRYKPERTGTPMPLATGAFDIIRSRVAASSSRVT